ncbi:MAG: hypothetical protein MZW92_10135 [Comamonadaceae bacterium]|nr:hypothetical protein [Comamonadaceae bacterium]
MLPPGGRTSGAASRARAGRAERDELGGEAVVAAAESSAGKRSTIDGDPRTEGRASPVRTAGRGRAARRSGEADGEGRESEGRDAYCHGRSPRGLS